MNDTKEKRMVKRTYAALPKSMGNMCMYGFHWMEFVAQIPSPLYIVTSYKSNGFSNACMQSWTTFTGGKNGYYAIVSAVSKYGHLYQTLHETGEAVINFMSADIYDQCMATIGQNRFDVDEILAAGLTAVKAEAVNAPMIEECFLNLECRFKWEKEIAAGDDHVLVCLEIVRMHMDERHLDENDLGRTGKTGILYNVHHPINPESFSGTAHDYLGVVEKIRDYAEY